MHQAIIILSEDQRMLAETMARETDADILSVKDVEKSWKDYEAFVFIAKDNKKCRQQKYKYKEIYTK